ncbi:hypothetical protein [Paenibacillus nuruki]|nr:hypothetical protein [Paenibacillus nuruki]
MKYEVLKFFGKGTPLREQNRSCRRLLLSTPLISRFAVRTR